METKDLCASFPTHQHLQSGAKNDTTLVLISMLHLIY